MKILITGTAGFIGFHLCQRLLERGDQVIGLDNINDYYDVSLKEPCAIVMGSEDRGISPSILKLADDKVKLPLLGDIASLNVSVACGVFLYEVVRQRL